MKENNHFERAGSVIEDPNRSEELLIQSSLTEICSYLARNTPRLVTGRITATIPEETDIALRHGSRNPIPDPNPNRPFTEEELRRIAIHEAYQRSVLSGFTIQELDLCGAWSTDDAIPSDLELPIHPIWERPMWCCERADDIGNGFSGTWDVVANDELWNALKPSLRIATLLITHSGLLPWLDALMLSTWKTVPAFAVPDGCQANSTVYNTYSTHTRSPTQASKSVTALRAAVDSIRRGYLSLEINPTINSKSGFAWAFTTRLPQMRNGKKEYGGSLISLSTEMVFPLLMQNLTVSERLVQQFGVAKTLTHETTHALGAYAANTNKIPFNSAEPFFEDDAISELSNSWEVFVFGALTTPSRSEANLQRPFLALGTMDWPNWLYYGNGRHVPTQPERYKYTSQFDPGKAKDRYDLFPIRLSYIQDIQQRLEQRAKRDAKAREGEAEEIKLLDHALQVYEPENENKCVQIYGSLKDSKFARVRAEWFFCLSDMDLYLRFKGHSKGDLRRLAIQEARRFERDQSAGERLQLVLETVGNRKDAHKLAKAQREGQGVGKGVAGGNDQEQFSEEMDIDDDGELIEKDCVIVEEWAKVY